MESFVQPLPHTTALPGQQCQVFESHNVFVSIGVNLDEGLQGLDDACLGDIYELAQEAQPKKLTLQRGVAGATIAEGSALGTAGAAVKIMARYTLMATGGDTLELLALQISDEAGLSDCYVLPLSPMGAKIEYTLVKKEEPQPEERLTDLLCISFARGTMITLGDGSQHPIESLQIGDRVLTRDHGPQPLRWVGNVTLRAVGAFAPVVISAGAMGNDGDLVVSQHHRMFLYQRRKAEGVPKSEILVQAKHLVDGTSIFIRETGFVSFYSLVFDAHEIIYAEGIPAESLMVTDATVSRLPPELAVDIQERFPNLTQIQHFGVEAGPQVLAALGFDATNRSKGGR
jgi:hypothetical protein